ncbi:MAG: hypothetical protein J6S78_03745, partial [Lachnospiraceae bacterium]|nr:hypothetical protein [Lachnospiraceae bacterium]
FDTLCQMVEDEMLDDKTVLKFVHVIFSKHFISNPPAFLRKNNRIVELLRLFERKERYIQILNQERQIHELEIARIRIESRENKDIFRDRVGKLFNRIVNSDSYRTANKEQLWIGFFKLIRGEGCGIPIELLEYIAKTEDKGFYKKITQYIDRIVKMFDFSHFVEISEDHYEYYEEILLWIIEKMDQEDLASRYVLFRLYSKTRQFDKGIKCSEEIIQRESPETAYIGAIREMGILDRMAKAICDETTPGSKNQITEINRRINEIYRRATSNIPVGASDYLEQYCALTNEYARIQINKKSFDVAFKALTQTINIVEEKEEKSEKMARLFLTMGTLCQRRKGRNPFFQNTSAKKWFEKALDCCVNDKERIYVLKPLSKTLLDLGEYEEVKRCCYMMRKLSKHDKEIKVIYVEACRLQDIKTNGFAEAVLPERIPLETATKEEVIDCLCQMYVAMTDKQMQYAKNYWSSLDSFEERIQRASKAQLCQLVSCLYHILNNTLIPPQTLSIIWKFKC